MNDPDLPEWIKPDFSTTTPDDVAVACILMMGGMQQYFSYTMITCGLPSVTLLGEKNDWERIFNKIDRLAAMSEQAATFHSLLKPVLGYFVRSFDEPRGEEVISFWNRIVHFQSMGSGPTYLSGWITAFCFWDFEGNTLYHAPQAQVSGDMWSRYSTAGCDLDGTLYHRVDGDHIPAGYMGAPVKDESRPGKELRIVAGSVGIRCTSSGEPMEMNPHRWRMSSQRTRMSVTKEGVVGLDSLQPISGWWVFEMLAETEKEVEKGKKSSKVKKPSKVKKSTVEKKVKVEKLGKALEEYQEMPAKNEEKSINLKEEQIY
jgi:Domain of unknown function (DUF4419)